MKIQINKERAVGSKKEVLALGLAAVVASVRSSRTGITIKGQLNTTANTPCILQFFSNPSGTDEGRPYIGETSVTTDSSGSVSCTFKDKKKVDKGQNVTATAN